MSRNRLHRRHRGTPEFAASSERIVRLVDLYADLETGARVFAGVPTIRHGRRRLVFGSLTEGSIGTGVGERTRALLSTDTRTRAAHEDAS